MSDEEDKKLDLDAWEPQLPPSDFAEKVLTRVRAEAPAPSVKRSRRWGVATGAIATIALAAAIALRVSSPTAHGDAIAHARTEVSIGSRAVAVLEPGAELKWYGDDVVQNKGDVFYRVERGARFRVHTPAGDVEVKGTCFVVKVAEMQKSNLKSGAVGAIATALAFVAVYEGKVAVSHAGQSVELTAGQSAQSGGGSVTATGAVHEGQRSYEAALEAGAENDPFAKANENLVSQVAEYRKRLESIATQKSELEDKLKKTEEKLASTGDAGRGRSEWDLTQDDWRDLAKEGAVKYRVPCHAKEMWNFTPEKLQTLGLAPGDAATLREAYQRSYERVWAQIKPLCVQAIGNADVVEKIGPSSCPHIIYDVQLAIDADAAKEAHTLAAEIRAGMRPEPGPNEKVHPVTKMFLVLSTANKAFEADLAKSFGPEDAHRLAMSDDMCNSNSRWGGGKKREK